MSVSRREFLGRGLLGSGALALGCARRPDACIEQPSPTTTTPDPTELELSPLEGACAGVEPIAAAEFERRIERARAVMQTHGFDALVLEPGDDQRYFCGVRWWPTASPALLCVARRGGDPFLTTAEFEVETITGQMGPFAVPLRPWTPERTPFEVAAAGLSGWLDAGARVGFGPTTRSFVIEALRAAGPSWTWASGTAIVDACRMIKSPPELALLRRANEATQAALALVSTHAREGQTELELEAIMLAALRAAGLDDAWALVQFGEDAAEPHGSAGARALRDGDLILIDTGGFLHGYASDITRTFACGAIDDRRRRAWDTVLAAQSAALAAMRPGVRCAEIDAVAREVIAASGFGAGYDAFSHRLGHGIGIAVHEEPYLGERSVHALAPGMTMSNEPGIYIAGEFGVRIEDIVHVTEAGPEVFGRRALSLEQPFG